MLVDPEGYLHLTYCTNIHPGETLSEVEQNLLDYAVPLKEALAPDVPFGVGLRLSDQASRELTSGDRIERFSELLSAQGLYVFTLNGFPYGGFHRTVVKDRVYAPDWRTKERLDYTLRLARILAALLPEGQEGSISTSPLSYKPWLSGPERRAAFETSATHLALLAGELDELRRETGRLIHVAVEPEPDCLLENTAETIDFFESWLLRTGIQQLAQALGPGPAQAEAVIREHVRVCYDTCHFAVEFERPHESLDAFAAAGIQLGKVQASSALRARLDGDDARTSLASELEPFAESTYFHQVVERRPDGQTRRYPDLPQALPHLPDSEALEWRIHYHVPIFTSTYGRLQSTQEDLIEAVEKVLADRSCPHLEIETYTWDVLPEDLKTDVVTSIRREYEWLIERFALVAS